MPLSSIDDAKGDGAAPAFHARMRDEEPGDAIGHRAIAQVRRDGVTPIVSNTVAAPDDAPHDMCDSGSRDQLAAFPDGSPASLSAPEAPLSRGYAI